MSCIDNMPSPCGIGFVEVAVVVEITEVVVAGVVDDVVYVGELEDVTVVDCEVSVVTVNVVVLVVLGELVPNPPNDNAEIIIIDMMNVATPAVTTLLFVLMRPS